MGLLRNDGLILVDKNGNITLTEAGLAIAKKIYERHTLLSEFLELLGVDEKTATEDACKIEHVISDTSFQALKNHVMQKKS